jgi:hypothetical protein
LWNHIGLMTDLTQPDVEHLMARGMSFACAIWRLYGAKAGFEAQYKDALIDLGTHHPPCREHIRNVELYAVATFAHTLGVVPSVDRGGAPMVDDASEPSRDGCVCGV